MGTWQCIKNAVEKQMTDKCIFTDMQEQTTVWGETKMIPKQQMETICKLINQKQNMEKKDLIWENRKKGVLLYPADMTIPQGSLVMIEKQSGVVYKGKIGGSVSFCTHKEAQWQETEVFG